MLHRLASAGIVLGVTVVLVGVGWLISIGLYNLGLWPLGALVRVGVWIVAIFGAYWVFRHLFLETERQRILKRIAQRPPE